MTTGLVVGKFLPFHKGHQYLIDFAQNYVDLLWIVIGTLPTESISGEQRRKWLKEMFPRAMVIEVPDNNPPNMVENQERYFTIWRDNLLNFLPYKPEYLFASEDYGWKLAEVMKMKYIPVDHNRNLVSVSATQIRNNPIENWKYIPEIVRPYYVKRVCIYGPESTGKSTLTNELAGYYNTVAVDEYARGLLNFSHGKFTYEDIEIIARGHKASEEALARQANKIMFIDTDLITTKIYSELFFNNYPFWFNEVIREKKYDLYILTNIDVPWEKDEQRYFPNKTEREEQMRLFEDKLNVYKKKYIKVSGDRMTRLKTSIKSVDKLLK